MQALGDGQLLLLGLGHMGQSLLAGWRPTSIDVVLCLPPYVPSTREAK